MIWKRALGLGLMACSMATAAGAQSTPSVPNPTPPGYTSLVVFGDSLVDAGNIRRLGLGASPTQGYYAGRFTNGYDYTDLLSVQLFGTLTTPSLAGGTNFAYGGARATATSLVPDLGEQLGQYNAYLAAGHSVDSTGLYILNFGGNDVFAAADDKPVPGYASDSAFLQAAANVYASGIQSLNDLGARNILVTGFPVATPGPGLDASIEAEGYFTAALQSLNLSSDTTLYRFNYLDFFGRVQADPTAFGLPATLIIPDTSTPATQAATTCLGQRAYPDCTGFFSFDGVHPTAAIQRALFNDINRQFNLAAPVPEPATWAMLILGFALVGASVRYRRARVRVTYA